MTILNIFHTGGLTLALTLLWFVSTLLWTLSIIKKHNTEYGFNDNDNNGKWVKLGDKTPLSKIHHFKYAVAVTVLYIVAMIAIAIDYKGV